MQHPGVTDCGSEGIQSESAIWDGTPVSGATRRESTRPGRRKSRRAPRAADVATTGRPLAKVYMMKTQLREGQFFPGEATRIQHDRKVRPISLGREHAATWTPGHFFPGEESDPWQTLNGALIPTRPNVGPAARKAKRPRRRITCPSCKLMGVVQSRVTREARLTLAGWMMALSSFQRCDYGSMC